MSDLSTVVMTPAVVDIRTIGVMEERIMPNEKPERHRTPGEINTMPLTAALLGVAANGISFATPGHRSGRSLRFR